MAPPPSSSLLRDLLVADGFKNRRRSSDGSAPASSRAASMPLNNRRPGKPARSQSDVIARSRLREMNGGDRDAAGDERRAATATRRLSASQTSARSYSNKGDSDSGGAGGRRGTAASASAAAVPALDESALTALISLAAGPMKRFAKDEAFRATLRAGCASCLGESNHRAVLDLRVHAQTVERAAREGGRDPRDLKRASLKLHEAASLESGDADAVAAAAGVPYPRLAACAHLYMSAVSTLQRRDHSAAVHSLEAFCLAPREARTLLLPALWDRLFRPGLSHLRAWRDRESAAASSDERAKEVEKTFADAVDEGTRALACYYRDWLLGRTDAMALPGVPAPPSTVHAGAPRYSASTSYDISSDVVFSSGGSSPAKFAYDGTMQRSEEIEEEDEVHAIAADAESVFYECEAVEARSHTPALQFLSEGPLQSDADGNHFSIFATVPSDFLCPLTRQIFNNPVTIETGQTFERHAIVQWLDRGFRTCPFTGQELLSLSIPDTNRVLKRLIDGWKSERCKNLVSGSTGLEEKLSVTVIDKVFSSAGDMSEKLDKARHLMAIGGIDFLLHEFQEGGGDEQQRVAEHLLFCIRAEGSCRNYVAIKIDGSSVLRLLHSEVRSARRIAAEPNEDSIYREEAAKIITHSLRRCMSEDNVVPGTRKALLLLAGYFSFSGDLLVEDWMLKQAGFVDGSRASPTSSDVVAQDKEAAGNEAWLRHAAAALLGRGGVRRPFLEALSRCLGSPDADLVAACLATAAWLSRSLAASLDDDATNTGTDTDASLAAFSALVPRLKQCLAPSRPARHRVLAAVSLHNFSMIPDCRELLVLLADGLRDHLAELAGLTSTAGQLSAELHEGL
uniref:RING-type E3 ubiquitin transferase n=1 Tax=Setaria italica TaxID=4555 RepID=K3YBQ8_SETIT